jgi:phytoene dehydrogenase-like protein
VSEPQRHAPSSAALDAPFDVAVAGAGFGGLSTALLLARMGHRVALIEAERNVGGFLRSYKRGGIDCPVGVHYFGAAGRDEFLGQFFDLLGVREALKLTRTGTRGIIDRYRFPNSTFELPSTYEALQTVLQGRHSASPRALEFVLSNLQSMMQALRFLPDGTLGTAGLLSGSLTRSTAEILDDYDAPQGIRDFLSIQGFWTGSDLDRSPLHASFMAIASLLVSAWHLGCTGAEMADELAARARAAGVTLITRDPVTQLLVEGGAASGLVLKSGRSVTAKKVVLGIHPKHLLRIAPPGALPTDYLEGLAKLEETISMFGAVALVDSDKQPPREHNFYLVYDEPAGKNAVFVQIGPSTVPNKSRLVLLTRSDFEQWADWKESRTGKRGQAYRQHKTSLARNLLTLAEEVIGPVGEAHIVDTWSPLSARDWVQTPNGSAYGVRHCAKDGLQFVVLTRPPFSRLYLVGQSAISPGLIGVAFGVLRCVGEVAGRVRLRTFIAEELASRQVCS